MALQILQSLVRDSKYSLIRLLVTITALVIPSIGVSAQTPGAMPDPLPPVFSGPAVVEHASAGGSLLLSINVIDDHVVAAVRLHYRVTRVLPYTSANSEAVFRQMDFIQNAGGIFQLELPGYQGDENILEYYIEARDGAGNIARLGDPLHPYVETLISSQQAEIRLQKSRYISGLSVTTPELPAGWQMRQMVLEEPVPRRNTSTNGSKRKWWLWALAGGVVAGLILSNNSDSSSAPTGSITISGPAP